MDRLTLTAHYGHQVEVDHCASCRLLWFDAMESVALSRQGLMALFRLIGNDARQRAGQLSTELHCARCARPLETIHNLTRFGKTLHLRCPARHGHAVTHLNFLSEKGLLRAPTAADLAPDGPLATTLACLQCGAPVQSFADGRCSYCHTPLAILDVSRAVAALDAAEALRHSPPPTPAADDAGSRTSARRTSRFAAEPDAMDAIDALLAAFRVLAR